MWYDATTWRGNYWRVLLTKRRGWAWKRHNLASQALTLCRCYHLQDLLVNLPLLAPWLSLHPALQSTHFAQVPAPPVLASPSRTFTAVCGLKGFMALLAWATGRKVHPFSSHQANCLHPERFGRAQENSIFMKISILYQKDLPRAKCSYCVCIP